MLQVLAWLRVPLGTSNLITNVKNVHIEESVTWRSEKDLKAISMFELQLVKYLS
jgi:hypothetical protein